MNVNCSATVVSAVMLLFYQSVSAEPAKTSIEEKGNIYQFANQCYLINVSESDSYLSKEDNGYGFSENKNSAVKFYMRPAALGVYLLFNQNKQYLIAEGEHLNFVSNLESEMTLNIPEKNYLITPVSYTHLTLPTTPYV